MKKSYIIPSVTKIRIDITSLVCASNYSARTTGLDDAPEWGDEYEGTTSAGVKEHSLWSEFEKW